MRNLLRVDYRQNFEANAEITFEDVWRMYSHIAANPFTPGSAAAELWTTRQIARANSNTLKWIKNYKALETPKRISSKRRLEQPVLKMDFATLADIRLRLDRSFIFIGSELFFIAEIREYDGDFALLVNDKHNQFFVTMYSSADIDLRSPEPQYIMYQRTPVFLTRCPSRSQRQGLNSENTLGVSVWPKRNINVCADISELMGGITTSKLPWSPHYEGLLSSGVLSSLRLSKEVAAFHTGEKLLVEFRGRELGQLKEDVVTLSPRDRERPWIELALNDVGLRTEV